MAARLRRTERRKSLRLACCNADGMRGRKLEFEHFLSLYVFDPIQVTFAGRPVIVLPVYISLSRPVIEVDVSACFGA